MHKLSRTQSSDFPFRNNLKSKIQNLKWMGILTILASLVGCVGMAQAQQVKNQPRVGVLLALSHSAIRDRIQAFREGLRDLGYMEGKNIVVEYRYADGNSTDCLILRRNLPGSKLTLSSRVARRQRVPPRKQLLQFPLSWLKTPILLETGS
jgi:putative ABC transport system substrate-binding protein